MGFLSFLFNAEPSEQEIRDFKRGQRLNEKAAIAHAVKARRQSEFKAAKAKAARQARRKG